MNNNLNFEAVKGYHLNLRKLNDDQTNFITENLIKDYRDFEGDNNLFHYAYSAPNNEYRFFNFTCFSLGVESEEISFDEYFNKLNTPKNDVYSNSEFNSESKIVGYKLIKEEYKEVAKIIALSHLGKDIKEYTGDFEMIGLHNGVRCKNNLQDAGVLDLWFEAVYQDESITLKSGKVLTASEIEEVKEILKNK